MLTVGFPVRRRDLRRTYTRAARPPDRSLTTTFLMGRQVRCHHIRMSVDLSGRVVLVTGGTKGLGRGLAEAYRTAGASVMTCARNARPDGDADFVAADLRDAAAAQQVVTATVERFGRLD